VANTSLLFSTCFGFNLRFTSCSKRCIFSVRSLTCSGVDGVNGMAFRCCLAAVLASARPTAEAGAMRALLPLHMATTLCSENYDQTRR